jgi:tetratricopeptide (TPR) repeat protein
LKEHQKAVEIEPQTKVYWAKLGMAQEKANDIQGAIKSYEKALNLEPDDTLMLYYLGKLYEKTGEIDKAIESYEKLLKLESNPDDAGQRLKSLKEKRDAEKPKSKTKSAGN